MFGLFGGNKNDSKDTRSMGSVSIDFVAINGVSLD